MRILGVLFFVLTSIQGLAQSQAKDDPALTTQANVIAIETAPGANTALRIGNMHKAEIASKINVNYAFVAGGIVNAYTGTVSNPITGYITGHIFVVGIPITNTGPATLNVNAKGVKNILGPTGAALTGGELPANSYVWLVYNGTALQMIGSTGSGGSVIGGSGINVSGSTVNWNGAISEDVIIPNSGGTHEITIGGDSGGATNRVTALNLYGGATNFSSINLFNDISITTTGTGVIQLFNPTGGTISINDNVTLEGVGISIQSDASAIEIVSGAEILMTPQGPVSIGGTSANPGRIQLYEDTDFGSNYTEFKTGPQAGNISYTLPTAAPAVNGYVLSGSTAGVLSWVAQSGGGGLVDGDYGDITVGGSGTTMTIDNGVVNDAKIATHTTTKISTTNKSLLNSAIVYNDQANTYSDGTVQTFNPSNTNPGFVMGSNSSRPSSPIEGALFFNTTTKDVETYIDGVWSGMTRGEDITDATTARTITDSDRNKTVTFTSSSSITVTLNGTPEVGTAVCIWKAAGSGTITISASGSLKAVSNQMLTDNTGAWFVHEGSGVWRGMGALGAVASGTFVGLTDGPGAFTGKTLNYPRVNAGETALEYRTPAQVRADIGAGTGSGDALTTNPLSQFAATTSAQLRGVLSDEVGTGAAYFVGGALGTPPSGVATNLTGTASGLTAGNVTTNANLTGPITSSGNATSVASQTGTGSVFVMNTSPTLVTPNLGTPSAGVLTNATGLPGTSVINTPAGNISTTNVQAALNELDAEKQDALGYIPVNPANNGTDFSSASTTLQNLGGMEKTSVKNVQTGDYTLQASDFNTNTTIYMDNGSTPRTLTIPLAALSAVPTIRTVLVRRLGTASVTIVGAVGTTINPPGGSNTDPGQGYLFAISKDGVGAATYTIDNGGVALGPANSLLAVNNAGTVQEYKVVSEGLTAGSGTLQIGGAVTSDKTFTGAFSWGFGVAPAAKLTVRGLNTGTGSLALFEDSGGTDRLLLADNGKITWVSAQSGAGIVGFSASAALTATANTQTMTGFNLSTTVAYGGFTGDTAIPFRFNDTGAANDYWNVTISTSGASTAQNFNSAGFYNFANSASTAIIRNSAAALSIRGGTASTAKMLQLSTTVASSTNNNAAFNFTGNIHDYGSAITRTNTALLHDYSVTSVNGSNITYNHEQIIPSFSVGNSTLTLTGPSWNPSITGSGTISNTGFTSMSGALNGFGTLTPTATLHVVGSEKVDGNLTLVSAGNGILIKEGTNATMGVATLVAGTVTVSTTKVTANSRILLTGQNLGTITVPVGYAVSARTAGTSFTILSANVVDTSTVAWVILEPAP